MPDCYPPIARKLTKPKTEDSNPAIQLFGRRFFTDQSVPELLIEFFLVASSVKRIGQHILGTQDCFPEMPFLLNWPDMNSLEYAPKSRLNLKLFAFLGASKLETRHQIHRDHYTELIDKIKGRLEVSDGITKQDILKTIEKMFLGFQRVGGQRTWCAQSFLPICPEMISEETIWKETKAKKDNIDSWKEIIFNRGYFLTNQRIFLARGGESLYLQICNALRTSSDTIISWIDEINGDCSMEEEVVPEKLRDTLSAEINRIVKGNLSGLGLLAAFIDQGVDQETQKGTDLDSNGEPRFTSCGWCPEETWKEGHLFAVDLLRICKAGLDPVERLAFLETACAIQVLRTLCAQSARHDPFFTNGSGAPLGYVWAVSDPEGKDSVLKLISRRSVEKNLLCIQRAIRCPEIKANVAEQEQFAKRQGRAWTDPYKEADTRYGHKLFLSIAKRVGFVVPRRGPGARFVLTDHLLRYLVLTCIRAGERMTYDSFLDQVFQRIGIALGNKQMAMACEWCGSKPPSALNGKADQWVEDMLQGAGVLVHLSDSCSMVENPLD
jgi:hypothetical protein